MTRRPRGYYQDFQNIERELKEIAAHVGYYPRYVDIRELGRTSLAAAIDKYYGGLNKVRKRLKYKSHTTRPRGFWNKKGNVIREAKFIIINHNLSELPNEATLRKMGYGGFTYAVYKMYGGIPALRKELGQTSRIDTKSKLTSLLEQYAGSS
ncbi:hypothetical protein KW805_01190 [Candidatus Pacearchaeota archaeon]|nr:hypothetical protein [Candidatus Pacearchaeota archaeon]